MTSISERRISILAALSAEFRRQGIDPANVEVEAVATAVECALENPQPEDVDALSKEPEELNAANDG
jgi:hypothetical protein